MKMQITKEDLPKLVGRFIYEIREKDGKSQYLDITKESKEKQEFLFIKRVTQVMYSPKHTEENSLLTMYDYLGNPIHSETIEEFIKWFNSRNYRLLYKSELDYLFDLIKGRYYE